MSSVFVKAPIPRKVKSFVNIQKRHSEGLQQLFLNLVETTTPARRHVSCTIRGGSIVSIYTVYVKGRRRLPIHIHYRVVDANMLNYDSNGVAVINPILVAPVCAVYVGGLE
jgi:hypothetical protein